MKIHYVCAYRLDQQEAYLIWFNSKPDGVVVDWVGFVPAFQDRSSLREYVVSHHLFFDGQDEILDNLDTVKHWLASPDRNTVNCVDFLNAWNLFGDIAKSVGDENFDSQPQKTNNIYQKLFLGNNLPGVSMAGEYYDPTWTQGEVELLGEVLDYGLQMFRYRVRVS